MGLGVNFEWLFISRLLLHLLPTLHFGMHIHTPKAYTIFRTAYHYLGLHSKTRGNFKGSNCRQYHTREQKVETTTIQLTPFCMDASAM